MAQWDVVTLVAAGDIAGSGDGAAAVQLALCAAPPVLNVYGVHGGVANCSANEAWFR
jgi:hypothetical protein